MDTPSKVRGKTITNRKGSLRFTVLDPEGVATVKVKIGNRFKNAKSGNGKRFNLDTMGQKVRRNLLIRITDKYGITTEMRRKVR